MGGSCLSNLQILCRTERAMECALMYCTCQSQKEATFLRYLGAGRVPPGCGSRAWTKSASTSSLVYRTSQGFQSTADLPRAGCGGPGRDILRDYTLEAFWIQGVPKRPKVHTCTPTLEASLRDCRWLPCRQAEARKHRFKQNSHLSSAGFFRRFTYGSLTVTSSYFAKLCYFLQPL